MTETVSRDFAPRLHLLAVGFVVSIGPSVEDAVVLAEDLVASGFPGPSTLEVAALPRGAILSEAEPPIRAMLAEHGIQVPVIQDDVVEYGLLLTAFGFWNLPLHHFEGPFYRQVPAWDDQGPLDRQLIVLLDRRDLQMSPSAQNAIEDEMRAAVRALTPAG